MLRAGGRPAGWAPEVLEQVKVRYAEGQSAQQIASAMTWERQQPVSRCVVIGIIYRNGFIGPRTGKFGPKMDNGGDRRKRNSYLHAWIKRTMPASELPEADRSIWAKENLLNVALSRPPDPADRIKEAMRRLEARQRNFLWVPEKKAAVGSESAVDLLGLTLTTCRFPLWADDDDPNKFYCGAACDSDRAYCDKHHALTHRRDTYAERRAAYYKLS